VIFLRIWSIALCKASKA